MRQTDTGALIAQLRKEQGLTQKQLADQLHISNRTISKWERGVSKVKDTTPNMMNPLIHYQL